MSGCEKVAFIAQLGTETNTFSPLPTGVAAFREGVLIPRDASLVDPTGKGARMRAFRDLAEAGGWRVVEGLCAGAQPGGPTVRVTYERLRDELLAGLRAAAPVGLVLLACHGAMVADGYEDCEGDLLTRIRALVGPQTVVGVELDCHCHLSEAMVKAADVLVLFKEYPHTDIIERAADLFAICDAAARGRVRPTAAVFDCRMVGFYPTVQPPMADLVEMMRAAEAEPGVLSVSFAHGFPWGDTPDAGSKVLVVTDNDPARGAAVAERIGMAIYRARRALIPSLPRMQGALSAARRGDGLTVLADFADNPGGGAPGDSTFLLRALLESGLPGCVFGALYDPVAVRLCQEAGAGARLKLRVGGKLGPVSGAPLDIEAEVVALTDDLRQPMFGSVRSLGASAWVRAGDLDLVLCSVRQQVVAPEVFTELGVPLAEKRVVAVKSSEHFRTAFAPFAERILVVATPGCLQMDFAAIPYERRTQSFFPRVEDPLGAGL